MMNNSAINSSIRERTGKAFNRFQKERVPFSALRLGLTGDHAKEIGLDQIVKAHLRETDEVMASSDDTYAILMQGTSFDAAVSASKRLAKSLLTLKRTQESDINESWNASFEIIGCRKESEELCRTYLMLSSDALEKEEAIPARGKYRHYINSSESANHYGRIRNKVNITV